MELYWRSEKSDKKTETTFKRKNIYFLQKLWKLEKEFHNLPKGLKINDFDIRIILTSIGRKEIEEFGIVNIPANLNKFQKGKRQKYSGVIDQKIWYEVQSSFKLLLEQGEKKLLKQKEYKWFDAQVKSTAGLYWVEHSSKGLIYIGESSNIYDR